MREGSVTRRDRTTHVLHDELESGRGLDVAGPVDQDADVLTTPSVVARPCSWVARSKSPPRDPRLGPRDTCVRIDRPRAHQTEIDEHTVVAGREAGDAVPAAAHRDAEAVTHREAEGSLHVGAACDQPDRAPRGRHDTSIVVVPNAREQPLSGAGPQARHRTAPRPGRFRDLLTPV